MKVDLEPVTDHECMCAHELSPRSPVGQTVRLNVDGTQRGYYCMGCLGGMIMAIIAVQSNAAVMKATTTIGDTVMWSGIPMVVREVADHGVRGEDLGIGAEWYSWEVIEQTC